MYDPVEIKKEFYFGFFVKYADAVAMIDMEDLMNLGEALEFMDPELKAKWIHVLMCGSLYYVEVLNYSDDSNGWLLYERLGMVLEEWVELHWQGVPWKILQEFAVIVRYDKVVKIIEAAISE